MAATMTDYEFGFLRYEPWQLPRFTKKQLAGFEAEKIEMAVVELINRTKELRSLYTDFSVRYERMNATQTRFMGITGVCTDNQVRQVVYAKFVLASIMEWKPVNFNFSIAAFAEAGGPMHKTDSPNELCPYWETFFADLYDVVVALEKILADPTLAFDKTTLEHILQLLTTAEMKAGWVDSLLSTVSNSATIPGSRPPVTEADNYRTWNQFCLNIGNGMAITDAALHFFEKRDTLYRYRPLPTPLTKATQTRIWFPIDVDNGTPWLLHAQAIAQQPHHLLRQKPLDGVGAFADEPHLWMLTKTTDTAVVHDRCSLVSACCSRLHVWCPGRSPCKKWGPTDCVHVRAGAEECHDPHCKMVDWAKYNLCDKPGAVPAWPSRELDPLVYRTLRAKDGMLKERVQAVAAMA